MPSCTAVSHLTCLSNDFLRSQIPENGLVPRGGECESCHNYVLWGDVIRGCYRRSAGGIACGPEDEGEADDESDIPGSDVGEEDFPVALSAIKKRKISERQGTTSKKLKGLQASSVSKESSEGEFFDFGGISSTDDSDSLAIPSRKPRQPRQTLSPKKSKAKSGLLVSTTRPPRTAPRAKTVGGKYHMSALSNSSLSSNEGAHLDLDAVNLVGQADEGVGYRRSNINDPPCFAHASDLRTSIPAEALSTLRPVYREMDQAPFPPIISIEFLAGTAKRPSTGKPSFFPSAVVPDSKLPLRSRARRTKRMLAQEDVDLCDDNSSPPAEPEYPPNVTCGVKNLDIIDSGEESGMLVGALSVLSVSSPAGSPPKRAFLRVESGGISNNDNDESETIELSD